MRHLVVLLCASVALYGGPVGAEAPPASGGAGSIGSGGVGASGFERPWPLRTRRERLAQVDEAAPAGDPIGDIDARIAELEGKRDAIAVRAPRMAMIAGGAVSLAGAGLLVSGAVGCQYGSDIFFQDHDASCGNDVWNRYWISGGLLAGIGLITLTTSAIVFSSRSKQRKAIDREILDLQHGRKASTASSTWSLSFDAGDRKMLGLSMQF